MYVPAFLENATASNQSVAYLTIRLSKSMGRSFAAPPPKALCAASEFVMEPPGYQLHVWDRPFGVVSHTAFIGEFDGPYPFYDEAGLID